MAVNPWYFGGPTVHSLSPERLKDLQERLDTVYEALNLDWKQQEFTALLADLAAGAQSSEMWALVGRWAGERA